MKKYVLLIFTVLFLLGACSNSIQDRIVGKWIADKSAPGLLKSGKIRWFEFLEDGTVTFLAPRSMFCSRSCTGSYDFIDKNKIKLDFKISQYVLDVEINDDILTITSPGEKPGTYRRSEAE